MIPLRADELDGVRVVRGPATAIRGLTSDSRRVREGDLFVALRGGVAHVAEAADAGAAAVLVPEAAVSDANSTRAPCVLAAADTILALQAIGAQNRRRSRALIVGITGSAGKTTSKDLAAAMLAPLGPVVAAEDGHNNELGVPLTLSAIRPETVVCVVEIGMRGPGEIQAMATLAAPRAGLITNVGIAHLERLGSREAIAQAKGELLDALPVGGFAVVPDEPLLEPYLRPELAVARFGEREGVTVRVVDRVVAEDGQRVGLEIAGVRRFATMRQVGPHHALNLAGVTALVLGLGVELEAALALAPAAIRSKWRDEVLALPGGGLVVNDAWNANPPAVTAALTALAERGSGRLVAVLGEMAELGPTAPALHRAVGADASALGYDVIVAVGEPARGFLEGAGPIASPYFLPDSAELGDLLASIVRPGDRVLVKGSRSGGLEGVAADLVRRLEGNAA